MSLARAQTRTTQSRDEHTNHEVTVSPTEPLRHTPKILQFENWNLIENCYTRNTTMPQSTRVSLQFSAQGQPVFKDGQNIFELNSFIRETFPRYFKPGRQNLPYSRAVNTLESRRLMRNSRFSSAVLVE